VFFLVYVSAAHTWFSPSELQALLSASRQRNLAAAITGLLLYKDGNFMQALEGDESAVRALHAKIVADHRHHGVVTLDSGHCDERQFAQWSMAFADLRATPEALPAGYSDFMTLPLVAPVFQAQPGRCQALLQLFRQMD
jgi:Sensors of blue-light using FAD